MTRRPVAASTTDTAVLAGSGDGTGGKSLKPKHIPNKTVPSSSSRTNHHQHQRTQSCHHLITTTTSTTGLFPRMFPPRIVHHRSPTAAPSIRTVLLPSLLVRTIIPRGSTTTTITNCCCVNGGDVRRITSTEDRSNSLPSNRLQCKRCVTADLRRRRRRQGSRKLNAGSSRRTSSRGMLNSQSSCRVRPAQLLFAY